MPKKPGGGLSGHMGAEIAIIDYSAGNLRSVDNALKILGYRAEITQSPQVVRDARVVVLPGVGAAADTMTNLRNLGLVEAVKEVVKAGKPFLGVCIGLQVLYDATEEGGRHECLGIVPGTVKRLPEGLKVPHMGWNQVRQVRSHPVFEGIDDGANFYFVHSYYGEPEDASVIIGETGYGVTFGSVIARDNIVATQFHPEKSGPAGLRFYDNFMRGAVK